MKNKQINKFVFMFVIGLSLLFSCSYASDILISDGQTFQYLNACGASNGSLVRPSIGLSYTEIRDAIFSHLNQVAEDASYKSNEFNVLMSEIMTFYNTEYSENFNSYYLQKISDSSFYLFFFNSNEGEFWISLGSTTVFCYSFLEDSNFVLLSPVSGSNVLGGSYYLKTKGNTCNITSAGGNGIFSTRPFVSNCSLKQVQSYSYSEKGSASYYTFSWDGSYYQKIEEKPEGPFLTDDDIANAINIFLSSEDLAINRPSGYDDYYITYNSVVGQYYIYLYKSSLSLAMRYGDFDDVGNFNFNDKATGDGYRIFQHSFDGDLNFVEELWSTICEYLSNSKYYCFRVNPTVNKCHYITSYSDDVLVYTTSEDYIVYSTKDITLLVGSGVSGTIIDTENSIPSKTLVNSSTNEEYEFTMPETSVSDTPWNRFISMVNGIPSKIISVITDSSGLSRIMFIATPLVEAIRLMLGVLLSSISLLSRAVTFVYTLPTIEASDALFLADVDSTTGLVFTGNSWGIKFLEGLNMVKEFSWNGLNLWTLFTSFIVAMFAIHCIKLVRKHYHY